MTPFEAGLLAWRTALVFTTRSAGLWASPADAPAKLAAYAAEKQRAFSAGAFAAVRLSLSGASPEAIAAAALAPAARRVKANSRR